MLINPEKTTIIITKGVSWVRALEIYPCLNLACPEPVHQATYDTHADIIKMLNRHSKQILNLIPSQDGDA